MASSYCQNTFGVTAKESTKELRRDVKRETRVDPEGEISILDPFSDIPMTVRRCWPGSSIELPWWKSQGLK